MKLKLGPFEFEVEIDALIIMFFGLILVILAIGVVIHG